MHLCLCSGSITARGSTACHSCTGYYLFKSQRQWGGITGNRLWGKTPTAIQGRATTGEKNSITKRSRNRHHQSRAQIIEDSRPMTTPAASPLARFLVCPSTSGSEPRSVRARPCGVSEWCKIATPTPQPKTGSAIFARLMGGISPDQVHLGRSRMPTNFPTRVLLHLLELSLILPRPAVFVDHIVIAGYGIFASLSPQNSAFYFYLYHFDIGYIS